jgi:signal transduction histidine kinase
MQPPQRAMITSLLVNNKIHPLEREGKLKFGPKQNDISIHYSAIDFTNGSQTKYSYRLIGEDTSWIPAGNLRQINFSRLAPGNYTFMVRAANDAGVWSDEPASISFSIRKPFTQTAWFYILLTIGIAGVFYALYRFRLRQLMRTEQIRTEISRNLHDEVGSTLTNISLGSLLAQKQLHNPEAMSRILERIYQDSQNISGVMREIVWSINPEIDTLGEALPRMLQYASELLEAKDITLQPEIAPEIEQMKLSMEQRRDIYLIFKEAVNNLARHSKARNASIRFNLSGNMLVMVVADDGAGFDLTSPVLNNGLKNMKERARSHRWQLGVQSQKGEGTTITLRAGIA